MNTQDLLDKIKPHARPTWGPQLDETAALAERNGWTIDALAETVNRGIGPNTGTGYVVRTLERLASSKRRTNETIDEYVTGPCQLGCDHGWTESTTKPGAAVPCRSCRPDTLRRLAQHDPTTGAIRTPHTYPVTTP